MDALGPLQIRRHGSLLPPEAWGSARPRELLLFLLCHPAGATREQIGVALWPDASSAQVRNNVHTALHRLRRALGETQWIVFAGDRYRVDPAVHVEFDAAAFEQEATAALATARTGHVDVAKLERALQRYRGPFLDGVVVGDWHIPLRDRLARLQLEIMHVLGAYWLDSDDAAQAIAIYRRIIQHDELDEDAYRQLMRCHARLGERAQALRVYQRLVAMLDTELGTSPAPETVRLAESL